MSDWEGVERRQRGRRRSDALAERRAVQAQTERDDIDELRDETANLVSEVHKLRGTLQAYAPRTEVTRELDRRITGVETRLRDDAERKVFALQRERRRQASRFAAIVVVAVLLAATVIDWHAHVGHYAVIERRLALIESVARDRGIPLDDLQQFDTHDVAPMFPAPEQESPPVGLTFYLFGVLAAVVLTVAGRPDGNDETGVRDGA